MNIPIPSQSKMAVEHEPYLAPPQASTPRSVVNSTSLLKTKAGVHYQTYRKGFETGTHDANKDNNFRGSSHLKVSAWEGSLPRLGFGSIDLSVLLDYENRPKTPNQTIYKSTPSRTRLPTSLFTHDEHLPELSAGLVTGLQDVSFPVTASTSSSTGTPTTSTIQYSSGGRDQSTLQSSPPAPVSLTADESRESLGQHTHPWEPSLAVGLRDALDHTTVFRSETPIQEVSELIQESEIPLTTTYISEAEPIQSPDSPICATDSTMHTPECTTPATPCRSYQTSNDNAELLTTRVFTPRKVIHQCEPRSGSIDPHEYLDLIRAAARTTTPRSRRSAYTEGFFETTASPRRTPRLQTSIVDMNSPLSHKTTSDSQIGVVQPTPPQSAAPPFHTVLKSSDAELRSIINGVYASASKKAGPLGQVHNIGKLRLGDASTASISICESANDNVDDEDDETGGCTVETLLGLQLKSTEFNQEAPRFSHKKPTAADKLIQDAFKAQVKEMVTFSAQFKAAPQLTKEEKFDCLVKKIQTKKLLTNDVGVNGPRDVHVFVDMSNIFIGFQDTAKISQGVSINARVTFSPFSFEHLAFVLERGRKTVKRKLAGSVRQAHQMNNLPLHIIEAQNYGFDTKILHQVVKLDRSQSLQNSPYNSADETHSAILCPRTKLGEQGVDETLHLSMQDSVLDAQGNPGIMVLATGDAKPAEYSDGFAHYAIKALKHGWIVEVVSWRKCLSSEWKKSPFKDKYTDQFRIILLDDFFDEIHADWVGGPSTVLARV